MTWKNKSDRDIVSMIQSTKKKKTGIKRNVKKIE